ncbi:DsbC family protein [Gammaproteobacteria bacterium]|nr:DsbC family protein [Gammaproteobacteria bacterium]
MSALLLRRIFLSITLWSFISASTAGDEELVSRGVKEKLLAISPNMPIDSVSPSEVPWLFQISLKDGSILYADKNGDFLFAGQVFELSEGRFNNLTENSKKKNRLALLSFSPESEMIIFPSKTPEPLATITVFTDIDCGYCRKLHREVGTLNQLGVKVRYLAFPRAGVGSDSYDKTVSAWCAEDPLDALTKAKLGEEIGARYCDNPVERHLQLGKKIGVSGTPAVFFEDGTLQPGYLEAGKMAELLGIR